LTTQSNTEVASEAVGDTAPGQVAGQVKDPLLDLVASVSGSEFLQVEEDLGAGFVRLNTAEAERRQARHDIRSVEDIIIEMLRNSRDAGARHIFIATSKEDRLRTLTVIDDGMGVPENLKDRIFEARVTSKLTSILEDAWGVHGRGMALYSIAQNVQDIVLCACGTGQGTAFHLRIDTQDLKERADQSTWPKVERDEDGTPQCVSGPRNLLRHIAEFALAHPKLKIYVGSPNEVLATLKSHGDERVGQSAGSDSTAIQTEIPHCLRPAHAEDASFLAECAAGLGLEISTRSAYRIDNNEISSLTNMYAMLTKDLLREALELDLSADLRGLKIDKQDLSEFAQEVERAFDTLAEKYYITPSSEPKVSIKKNTLRIRVDFEKEY